MAVHSVSFSFLFLAACRVLCWSICAFMMYSWSLPVLQGLQKLSPVSSIQSSFVFFCPISILCSFLRITYWLVTALHAELLNCCGLSASVWCLWVHFLFSTSLLFVADVCICLVLCSVLEQRMQDLNFEILFVYWSQSSYGHCVELDWWRPVVRMYCNINVAPCISITFPWNHLELPAIMPVTHTEYVSVHTSLCV